MPKKFTNLTPSRTPRLFDVIPFVFSRNPQAGEKRRDRFTAPIHVDTSLLAGQEECIIWLGHASFYIRLAGVNILTDPSYFSVHFRRRHIPLPFPLGTLPRIDYVIISHGHFDHCDKKSIQLILQHSPAVQFLVPRQMGRLLKKWGTQDSQIQEADWWQTFSTKPKITITFLPAQHWYRRNLFDYNHILWGSYSLQTPQKSLYFAGDTAYDKHFKLIYERWPAGFDYALMPIGAYKPPQLMKTSHVNPQESAQAANELHARTFIPMHYGTYDLSHEPAGEALATIKRLAEDKILQAKLLPLQVGENTKI